MSKRDSERQRGERGGGSLTLRGTVWLARWFDRNGRRHSRSTGESDRARAEDKLRLFASEAIADTIEEAKQRAVIQYEGRRAEEAAFLARQKEATPALALAEGWEAFLDSPNPDDRRLTISSLSSTSTPPTSAYYTRPCVKKKTGSANRCWYLPRSSVWTRWSPARSRTR